MWIIEFENLRGRKGRRRGGSSDSAFSWLLQSSWGLCVSLHSDARQPSQEPPCEAPLLVQRASPGYVPIHRLDALGKLLQSSPMAVRRVRWMQLVRPPACANQIAHSGA